MPVVLTGVLIRTNGSRSAPRRAGPARKRPRRSLSVPPAGYAASAWSSRCGTGTSASTVSGAAWSPPTAHDCAAGCPHGAWMTGLPVLLHQAGPADQLRGRAGADDHAIPLPTGRPLDPDRRGRLLLPPPTCSTTTRLRHCPTRRRKPATTWPRTSMSSESPAHPARSSDGSASRVTATGVVSCCSRQAAPSCSGAGGAGWVHPPGGCRGRFPARV